MRQDSVKFNLLTHGRLVLANGLGDGGLGRAIDNAGKDNTAFVEGKMEKSVIITHGKYLPFRQLSGIRIVRLNAAFVEVEMCERLKSTSFLSKWK